MFETSEECVEVGGGEFPFERGGGQLVELGEGVESGFDVCEAGEVVWG